LQGLFFPARSGRGAAGGNGRRDAGCLSGFFGFVIMRVTTPQMATLFTDLSYEDSSAIIKDLERPGYSL
jgi:hypothetical protein